MPSNNGTYSVDCSGFIGLVLSSLSITDPIKEVIDFIPKDFVPNIKNNMPSPLHYSFFFKFKPIKKYWDLIDDVYSLSPGDLILYTKHSIKYKNEEQNIEYGQHIMIVAGKAKKASIAPNTLWVPIFDSTKAPHGKTDQRAKNNTNGIGKGTIGLIINEYNNPIKLIWRDHSKDDKWQPLGKGIYERDIIMARIKSKLKLSK